MYWDIQCNTLKDFHVRHLFEAAKSILDLEKTEEPAGEDNKIKVIRHEQSKTYIEEMMTDRGRSTDNLAGLKASSGA